MSVPCPPWCVETKCEGEHYGLLRTTPASGANVLAWIVERDFAVGHVPMVAVRPAHSQHPSDGHEEPSVALFVSDANGEAEVNLRASEARTLIAHLATSLAAIEGSPDE